MYLNKAFLYGNLTRDPEIRALPSGVQVANFSIATNRVYKDKDGNKKEQVDFHNIVAFGRQAEVIGQYLKKGRPVFIDGRIQTRSWDDKATGQKKYRTEVVVENFQFGPSAGGGQGGGATASASGGGGSVSKESKEQGETIEYPAEDIKPEDIPF
ncbi:MAG: single-strand DNA-binding protein [Parcubacteria group bacterium Gr01-1014_72]|nr:MAG: single-strand DNA-binding protein [Parcubacteria group bacterium Gr01-1014_72]